ncbi:helix-turn-helix domain-containing protein [Hippea alviniae]|uniref:helix-turn-helix domain-containing protein n=1 Tax=Hippea alviniae TaxID=1279027 RepID=UPI000479B19F|nr:helix-turn-helix domain-containing protein [Hippea alviniae]
MYYSVKALLGLGKNISQIARELNIDRKTVERLRKRWKKEKLRHPLSEGKASLTHTGMKSWSI